ILRAASSLPSARRESTMTRIGCSREASLAASMASSSLPRVVAITRVSTRPRATAPPSSRILTRAFEIALVVVSGRSTIMILSGYAVSGCDCPRVVTSGTTPAAAVAGEQLVGGCGAPGAGLVLLQRPSEGLPVFFDGVEDLPAQFDFLVSREERRVTEQHVEDEPLVGLRTRLGEGVAVAEVHRHVAHLHAGSRHLGAEADGDPLIRLHADDERVGAECRGLRLREEVLRRALEHDGDLGDAAAETLAGAQVERHTRPAT